MLWRFRVAYLLERIGSLRVENSFTTLMITAVVAILARYRQKRRSSIEDERAMLTTLIIGADVGWTSVDWIVFVII